MPGAIRWFAAAFALLPASAFAQTAQGLDLSGTVRLRYEAITGQPRAGFNSDDDLVSLRTTLLARLRGGSGHGRRRAVGQPRDRRGRGTPITTGEVNTFELVQGYVGVTERVGTTTLGAQLGRFTLNIGSRRLVGSGRLPQHDERYTGLRADVTTHGGIGATAIYVLPQQRRPDDPAALRRGAVAFDHEGFDLVLWGATVAKARSIGAVTAEASFYHLGERDQPGRPTRDRSLDTYGGRLLRDPAAGKVDGEVEALWQSGTISASAAPGAAALAVSAWFVHAAAGYTIPGPLKARISLQYDVASGDRAGGRYGRFDTLYGMRRADLAPSGLYNAVGRANISTPGARIEVAPSVRWDAFAAYHALWLAEATDSFSTTGVRDATGRSGSFAGHQFDGRFRWWVRPSRLRLAIDAVVLAKGRFLRTAPNANDGSVGAYGSFSLTASF